MKFHNNLLETKGSKWPVASAGRLMTVHIPIVQMTATVGDIAKLLTEHAAVYKTINYIYVISERKELAGVLSIKDIFRQLSAMKVADLIKQQGRKELISVTSHTDQEHVALLALKHSLKAIPVVDNNKQLLGAVTSDTILRILDSEAVEDILRFSGIYHKSTVDNVLNDSLSVSIRHRLPWLVLGLAGGILAAGIIKFFEDLLAQHLILAAFIPLIVYVADAVGTQMEAFIIRDLALNPHLNFFRYLMRHFAVTTFIGSLLSIILFVATLVIYSNARVSVVVSAAPFFALVSSLVTGLVVPYLFGKLKFDPANASGPTATIIQDMVSVLVYFIVASWVL